MFDYKHPLGNYKIGIVKFCGKVFSNISLFFLSLLFKIDKSKNEIIISSSFYAPWKHDKSFYDFYNIIKEYTLLDTKRLFVRYKLILFYKDQKPARNCRFFLSLQKR